MNTTNLQTPVLNADETQRSNKLRLDDLLGTVSSLDFLQHYWSLHQPFLGRPTDQLIKQLVAIDGLKSPEAFLKKHQEEVGLFGPDSFRSNVSPRAALDFLPRGYNVYITGIERTIPQAKDLLLEVASGLGVPPWWLYLEAFAGSPGAVSSRHYDHDTNFQILLSGQKEWELEENRHIQNPRVAYHPSRDRLGKPHPYPEETFASSAIPESFDPQLRRVMKTEEGSVIFVPRGWWHQVRSLTSTWSINIVLKGQTFARALAESLVMRLHRNPAFRAYIDGLPYGDGEPIPRNDDFERLREAALQEISRVSVAEAALSISTKRYVWLADSREVIGAELHAPGKLDEPVELDVELLPAARALTRLRYPFSWEQALHAADPLAAITLHNFIDDLIELGVLAEDNQKS
jgi:50S ribosomal protein L16 3-hydroxylase